MSRSEGLEAPTLPAETGPGRISPDLASILVQRLFAAGLHLAQSQSALGDKALNDRIRAAVDELDLVIRDIRRAVLEQAPPDHDLVPWAPVCGRPLLAPWRTVGQ